MIIGLLKEKIRNSIGMKFVAALAMVVAVLMIKGRLNVGDFLSAVF